TAVQVDLRSGRSRDSLLQGVLVLEQGGLGTDRARHRIRASDPGLERQPRDSGGLSRRGKRQRPMRTATAADRLDRIDSDRRASSPGATGQKAATASTRQTRLQTTDSPAPGTHPPAPGTSTARSEAGAMRRKDIMPTGRVKWFDADKGFGFVIAEDGSQAFLHSSVLPEGLVATKGTRRRHDVGESRRGAQVRNARPLNTPGKVAKVRRRPTAEMAVMVEDVIKVLDDLNNGLQHGRYPDPTHGNKVASLLRAIADDLES